MRFYCKYIVENNNIQCRLALVGADWDDEPREQEDFGVVVLCLTSVEGLDAVIHLGNLRGFSFVLSD